MSILTALYSHQNLVFPVPVFKLLSHSNRCVVLSYNLNLYFPTPFHLLIFHLCIFLSEVSVQIFCPLFISLFLCSFKDSLYKWLQVHPRLDKLLMFSVNKGMDERKVKRSSWGIKKGRKEEREEGRKGGKGERKIQSQILGYKFYVQTKAFIFYYWPISLPHKPHPAMAGKMGGEHQTC